MLRRSLLRALPLLALGASSSLRVAHAKDETAKADGRTFSYRLESAPYPTKDGTYTDSTVLVFVPSFLRAREDARTDFVVHFHGHNTTAEAALAGHKLREQLSASRQNAIRVVPQGPVRAADGEFGKLMDKGGLRRLLGEVIARLRKEELGRAGLAKKAHPGRVVVSAHSGGYRAAARVGLVGGVSVREIYLFDAMYGEKESFKSFVTGKSDRKLVSYYVGGRPRELSLALADDLASTKVKVLREKDGSRLTRSDLVRGRAIFLEGRASHGTATFEEQALRDCLFASCLEGRGSEAWHAEKNKERSS